MVLQTIECAINCQKTPLNATSQQQDIKLNSRMRFSPKVTTTTTHANYQNIIIHIHSRENGFPYLLLFSHFAI